MGLKEGGKRGGRREATPTTPNTSKCIIINSNRTPYIESRTYGLWWWLSERERAGASF